VVVGDAGVRKFSWQGYKMGWEEALMGHGKGSIDSRDIAGEYLPGNLITEPAKAILGKY
jgi:hypothetical protein